MQKQIFYGGPILTMENRPQPEALLIHDGFIAALGSMEDMTRLCPGAEFIDLQGHTLLPAFIDSHSHIVQFANSLRFVSLRHCHKGEEIKDCLREHKIKNHLKPDQWLIGFGYDQNDLQEKEHPSRTLLDAVSKENPILISHISGHMGVANTAALQAAQIGSDTPDPSGGKIGREESGTPNGYLEETAFLAMGQYVPPATEEEMLSLLEKAQQIYLSYGITTVQEGRMQNPECSLLKRAAREQQLLLDIIGYADWKNCPELLHKNPEYVNRYHNHFKIGGYKIFLDGSPQGRTAWMTEPYLHGEPGYCGYPIYEDQEVAAFVEQAEQEKVQLLAHCNGDAAAAQLLRAQKHRSTYRNVMIHAQLLRPDQLPTVREAGIIPSYFVAHVYSWGDTHIENFGMDRAKDCSPAQSTIALGIPFTFHQDTPVLPPDMVETLWCAVNRRTRKGVLLGEDQRISPLEALTAVTKNAAYQYFEEKRKGTLSPGKVADLVILSENPLTCPPEKLKDISVLATYREGKRVFQK